MGKLIISMHISLDGFVAGPDGEMDWIGISDDMFDFVNHLTENADTALYSRKTFEMMDSYWPTAADKPDATKHDKEHSAWYKRVTKYVLSNSMKGKDVDKTKFISGDLENQVRSIKKQNDRNILIFGSPTAVHSLVNLIDEFYLFVNPVLLGKGIPMFKNIKEKLMLKLAEIKTFDSCDVACLHYTRA